MSALANETNGSEIIIRAETAIIDQKTGNAEYQGNAELVQGDRRMSADKITLEIVDNNPVKIEAFGNPVTLDEPNGASAKAEHIIYDVPQQRIWLYRQASISHEGRLFEGAELEYHLDTDQVKASGDGQDGRVKLVIPAAEPEEAN
jgi:lipopolysaccharide export system protein LptA